MPQADVLIIGSGAAGYSAAIYAARANLKPMLVTGMQPGGQLTITTDVENYPGFAEPIQGPWLMDQMRAQAENVGTQIIYDMIVSVDATATPVVAIGDSRTEYVGRALIVATGANARWLGLPSEQAFSGHGVSACATCDGFFFREQAVAVIGGGNSAVEEALYLTNHASRVTVIHRRDAFRAEQVLQDRLFSNPKIDVIWNSSVEEVLGTTEPVKAVTGLRLRHLKSGVVSTLGVDGLFVAIGHDPASGLFRGQLDIDEGGYIRIAPWSTRTNLPWVHSCGDVSDSKYRQAVVAAGMGCMAALETEKYLAESRVAEAALDSASTAPIPDLFRKSIEMRGAVNTV